MKNMSDYVICENGVVNTESTVEKFRQNLAEYIVALEASQTEIAQAISEVFDANKGVKMPLPALRTLAFAKLNVQPANYNEMVELFDSYIHANSGERDKALYGISKGKGGGCGRWTDLPTTPAK